MKSLEIEQYVESIGLMISYFLSNLPISNLIKYSLELLQLEIGWDYPILLSNYNKLSFLATNGWLKALWHNLFYCKIKLYLPSTHHPRSHILNNKAIMKMVLEITSFPLEKILLINLVYIKLQLLFISNLLEPSSNCIKDYYWQGWRDRFLSSSY